MTKKAKKVDVQRMLKEVAIPVFYIKKALDIPINDFDEIEKEKNVEGCKGLYYTFSNPKAKKMALKKWNELSLRDIKLAREPDEAQEAFEDAPPKSKAKKMALKKWNELSLVELEKAKTIEQLKNIYRTIPLKSKAEAKFFEKWLTFVTKIEDCEELWDYASYGSKYSKMIIQKAAGFYLF